MLASDCSTTPPGSSFCSVSAGSSRGRARAAALAREARVLTVCVLVALLVPPAVRAQGTREPGTDGRIAVRAEGSPLLYIGGTIGLRGEVFLGDIPAAPDRAGADGDGGSATGRSAGGPGSADLPAGTTSDDYLPPRPSGATLAGIEQSLDLTVDAKFGGAVQAFTRLSSRGVWGVGSASDASPWMPPVAQPLFIDEAWIRYSTSRLQVSAGRQRFSLGPVGLLGRTDLEAAEGVCVDVGFGGWYLTGIWSRLSSGYYYNSSFVTRADDLLAARVARQWRGGVVACNYLASGLGDEAGASVDVAGSVLGHNFAAELGLFRSSSTLYPEYRTEGWVPALVAKLEVANTPVHRLELSYGRIAPGFEPYYSSVASRSGGQALPFDRNTEGIALDYGRRVSAGTELLIRGARLWFLEEGGNGAATLEGGEDSALTQAEIVPTLSTAVRVTRELRSGTTAEVGYEHWWMKAGTSYGRLTAGITVNF